MADGAEYRGNYYKGQKQGSGILRIPELGVYEGEFS